MRGARRINAILAAVRGFLTLAVTMRDAPSWVMGVLYELADASDLAVEVRGEDGGPVLRLRQHRLHEPHRPVDRASDVEIVALLAACRTARDRLTVLLMARAGLRRSEVAGLRRSDMHLLGDSGRLGSRYGRPRSCGAAGEPERGMGQVPAATGGAAGPPGRTGR